MVLETCTWIQWKAQEIFFFYVALNKNFLRMLSMHLLKFSRKTLRNHDQNEKI
jgi:hypothetical protein